MSYLRVEGHSKLLKDPVTGVIVNDDAIEVDAARKRKKKKKELEQEVTSLRQQVEKLTSIIEQLVER